MGFRLSNQSIRRQLLALFGLLLLTGAAVLVIDEVAQYQARQSLQRLQDDSLGRLRALKAVADGYSLGVVDTTSKVRNKLIDWDRGLAVLDDTQSSIARNWQALQAMPRSPAQETLFARTLQARAEADGAATELRALLQQRDRKALARFADTRLYPSIDPVANRLQKLSDLAMVEAQDVIHADVRRGRIASVVRIGLSLLALLVAWLAGRRVLRNAYRGVEGLSWLVQRMREHDFTAQPRERPKGELGEVMDGFMDMRADVLKFETELTDQLARNEDVHQELEQRETFQRALLDAAQTAIVAVDADGSFTLVNPFAEQLAGWSAGELLSKQRLDVLFEPDSLQQLATQLSKNSGQPVAADMTALQLFARRKEAPREMQLLHRRGRALPVLLALSALHDDAGEPLGLLLVATDLSATKRLERALRGSETRAQEASHAKSAFLAAMSHEIRTPMIGVTGMVEVLALTRLDGDQRRALNVIQTSAHSLLQIIGDILDFSKIEAGRLELEPVACDLSRVLHSAVANFSGSASSKGLTLTCSVDDRIAPAYRADALRLRQILSNFLSNAVKFTEAGMVQAALEWRSGDPRGTPEQGNDRLCFRVTDTGIGVSAQAQQNLFQPFSQAEGDITRRFGGTGLGLAICRRLAELMDGEVSMESVPGLGTTMRLEVTLPRTPRADVLPEPKLATSANSFIARELPSIEQAERERSLVLLVDDHPTNRQVIARQLSLAGYASEAAEDGIEGLEKWRSGRYALLLSDVHMPRLNGYELARKIREEEARDGRERTPIVALTASALKGEAERCLEAGMDDYMAKPVGIPALTATLHRWLPHTVPTPEQQVDPRQSPTLPQLAHPPALDAATLDALTGGSASEARALLDDFLASNTQDLAELDSAHGNGDLPALTRQAHKIKGAARMIGAVELAEAAGQLEASSRDAEWPAIGPLAADLATASQRLRRYVDERYPA